MGRLRSVGRTTEGRAGDFAFRFCLPSVRILHFSALRRMTFSFPRSCLLPLVGFLLALGKAEAKGVLVSGPMLGYRAHREALIWLETRNAASISIDYRIVGQPKTALRKTIVQPPETPAGVQPVKFVLPLLEMGQRYEYFLTVDGQSLSFPYPLAFETSQQWEWRTPAPDFSFLFGTCAYQNEAPYDRPGEPYGGSREIFQAMARTSANFMVWGGDNVYLREADYSSESGIWYRYSHDRAVPEIQRLFASMNHYATWDDHDFGSDNSNRSFEFKGSTTAAFKLYWGNATWGEPDNPGIYGKFFWSDAAFVLMDNRTHRDDTNFDQNLRPEKTQYGPRQVDWLKQSLLHLEQLGHYPFKFIVTGGQFLAGFGGSSETHEYFQREREEILRFIADHKIGGVIFLTGDVHFTELARRKIGDRQTIYELTSSPLTSGPFASSPRIRANDPQRVEGTLVNERNFAQLSVSGHKGSRRLAIRCIDAAGVTRWERSIEESELK